MMETLHPVFDLWCQWCAEHNRFVPFNKWAGFAHPVDPIGNALLDYYSLTHIQTQAIEQFIDKHSYYADSQGPMASGYILCTECHATKGQEHRPGCEIPALKATIAKLRTIEDLPDGSVDDQTYFPGYD